MRAAGYARARDGAVSTAVQGARSEQSYASSCGPAAHELFISRLPLIDSVIRAVVRRHRLSSLDGEEFASIVHLRLMDNEHDILRRFQYRSSLRTFLMVVVQRLYLDFRNSQWGKWRPSAESRRQGSTAVLLEQLLSRDGLTVSEAVEVLRTRYGLTVPALTLASVSGRLRARRCRRPVSEDAIGEIPDSVPLPDTLAGRSELRGEVARMRSALRRALQTLDPQDRQLIALRFNAGMAIADIARALSLEPKPLYRRLTRTLTRLRRALESEAGIADMAKRMQEESWSDFEDCFEIGFGPMRTVRCQPSSTTVVEPRLRRSTSVTGRVQEPSVSGHTLPATQTA